MFSFIILHYKNIEETIECLTYLQKLDLMALIDEIAGKYHFTMTSEIEDYYKKQEEISQLLLQKILN